MRYSLKMHSSIRTRVRPAEYLELLRLERYGVRRSQTTTERLTLERKRR